MLQVQKILRVVLQCKYVGQIYRRKDRLDVLNKLTACILALIMTDKVFFRKTGICSDSI